MGWYSDVSHCDLVLVMGTSLSGLTIDSIAHSAGSLGKPRIVFDLSDAPVRSIQSEGPWVEAKDCFLQGAIDASILEMMHRLGWIQQLFEDTSYLDLLCLRSLTVLKEFLISHGEEEGGGVARIPMIDSAIVKGKERERRFYPDDESLRID